MADISSPVGTPQPAASAPTPTISDASTTTPPAASTPVIDLSKNTVPTNEPTIPEQITPPTTGTPYSSAVTSTSVTKSSATGPKPLVLLAVIVIALIAIVGIGYAALQLFNSAESNDSSTTATSDDDDDDSDEQDTDIDIDAEETTTFTGDYVTAELQEGWTIVEYENGDGSDMLVDGVGYFGLTGLEIIAPDSTVAFSIGAVNGVGGTDAFDEYFEFSDDDSDYQDERIAASEDAGGTPTVVEIADDDYVEYVLLGITVRRVDDALYWDTIPGDEYFQAGCGMAERFIIIDDISFAASGDEQHDYAWDIDGTLSDDELETMDTILESLDVV